MGSAVVPAPDPHRSAKNAKTAHQRKKARWLGNGIGRVVPKNRVYQLSRVVSCITRDPNLLARSIDAGSLRCSWRQRAIIGRKQQAQVYKALRRAVPKPCVAMATYVHPTCLVTA